MPRLLLVFLGPVAGGVSLIVCRADLFTIGARSELRAGKDEGSAEWLIG